MSSLTRLFYFLFCFLFCIIFNLVTAISEVQAISDAQAFPSMDPSNNLSSFNEPNTNSSYEIEVPASAQSTASEQKKTLQLGLKNLLIKMTGKARILEQEAVKQAIENVDHYVKQFSSQQSETGERSLKIQFTQHAIDGLIAKTGMAKLSQSEHRPNILVWLVAKDNQKTDWINDEFHPEIAGEFRTSAKRYGLNLLFPLLDLSETSKISPEHILNKDLSQIQEASKQYRTPLILLVKLTTIEKAGKAEKAEKVEKAENSAPHPQPKITLKSEWTLIKKGEILSSWEREVSDYKMLIGEGLEGLISETTGSRSSVVEDLNEDVEESEHPQHAEHKTHTLEQYQFVITGIDGLEQYAKIIEYLRKFPDIMTVELEEITPTHTSFQVGAKLTRDGLIQLIAKDPYLILEESASPKTSPGTNATENGAEPDATGTTTAEPVETEIAETLDTSVASVNSSAASVNSSENKPSNQHLKTPSNVLRYKYQGMM